VGITRIFSLVLWSHLAFLAISIALFGISVAGVFLYVRSSRYPPDQVFLFQSRAGRWMALSIILLTVLATNLPLDPMRSPYGTWILAAVYVVASIPFFFAGFAITLALTHLSAHANRVYAYDLIGAGIGCLIVVQALDGLGAPTPC
jgi:hypothetical protein